MNNYFRFKKFTIYQDLAAMKVGTDGVLLGAWAEIENARSILDIGTGTGLIALMAAQRNQQAIIEGIEIDPDACKQADSNCMASLWKDRIHIRHISIFDFHPSQQYECIICNPPFFINSTPTPYKSRTLARHCENFSHENLLRVAKRLLTDNGKFSLILPVQEALQFIALASKQSFYLSRLTKVRPTPDKEPKRFLIELTLCPQEAISNEIVIELSRHHYTAEYIQLTNEFYLKM